MQLVRVNFDAGLVAIMRETRYLKPLTAELPVDIPALALKVCTHHLPLCIFSESCFQFTTSQVVSKKWCVSL